MSIELKNITKTFGKFAALNNVSLKVETGELVALLGPSGSGKTTLLRIIAGLEVPDTSPDGQTGSIEFFGQDVATWHVRARNVGFVFQHYALFRHMTVFENVAFGLRARPWRLRPPRKEIKHRVMELLRLVQLEALASRYPGQLSGGQRQRVALGRALAVEPKVLLLDEPFGALDAKVRRELRRWLRRLHDDVGITSVFVTHDQEEALEVADRVAVMNQGKIEQIGTPDDVYENPANAFIYQFLGNVNLFHSRMEDGALHEPGPGSNGASARPPDKTVTYVRPHDVEIFREAGTATIPATVEHVGFAGTLVGVQLRRLDNSALVDAELTRERFKELNLKPQDSVHLRVRNARVFTEDYVI